MALSEADTRAKMIDPAIHKRGWTEDLIRREETAGSIEIINGSARRRSKGKVDYVLRVKVNPDTQPVAVALVEAKKDTLPPGYGLSQGKARADTSIYGQESSYTTWRPGKMNLAIRGIEGQSPHSATFYSDGYPDLKADFIVAKPPLNVSDRSGECLRACKPWRYGVPPKGALNGGKPDER